MSDFILNFAPLEGVNNTLRAATSGLNDSSERLRVQANRLAGQSGFGIPGIQASINALAQDIARLGGDVNLIAGFVTTLHDTTQRYEDMAFRELSGDVEASSGNVNPIDGGILDVAKSIYYSNIFQVGTLALAVYGARAAFLAGMRITVPKAPLALKLVKGSTTAISLFVNPLGTVLKAPVNPAISQLGGLVRATRGGGRKAAGQYLKGRPVAAQRALSRTSAKATTTAVKAKATTAKGIGAIAAKGAKFGAIGGPKGVVVGVAVAVVGAGVVAAWRRFRR